MTNIDTWNETKVKLERNRRIDKDLEERIMQEK